MKHSIWIVFAWIVCLKQGFGQNNRINTYETIGWYAYFGTCKVAKKLSIHTEYQWRRTHWITDAQQSMLRTGLNYHLRPDVLFRMGYAWIETYPYGDIPINSLGKDFTEHRLFEMAQLSHKEGIVEFSHRFMLEQRLVGRYASAASTREDAFPLLHRMRYMLRMQLPLKGTTIQDKTPYVALYDEIFIGFGKNVAANVFDQNRIGGLLGYKLNAVWRIEAGYLNQIVQLGRQVNGQNVFQNNNGFLLNTYLNLDFTK